MTILNKSQKGRLAKKQNEWGRASLEINPKSIGEICMGGGGCSRKKHWTKRWWRKLVKFFHYLFKGIQWGYNNLCAHVEDKVRICILWSFLLFLNIIGCSFYWLFYAVWPEVLRRLRVVHWTGTSKMSLLLAGSKA